MVWKNKKRYYEKFLETDEYKWVDIELFELAIREGKAEKPEYQKNYDDYVKKEITRLKQSPILEIFKNELKIKQKPKVKKTYNHVFLSDKILVTHNDNWFSEFKDHIDKFFIGVSKNV